MSLMIEAEGNFPGDIRDADAPLTPFFTYPRPRTSWDKSEEEGSRRRKPLSFLK